MFWIGAPQTRGELAIYLLIRMIALVPRWRRKR